MTPILFKENELWYFAHPYTCKNSKGEYVLGGEEANFRLCCYRSGMLIQKGYIIYSPIAHTHPIHIHSPQFVGQEVHSMWYKVDNIFIQNANFTGIILAPGWTESTGCRHELELFKEMKKPFMLYQDICEAI